MFPARLACVRHAASVRPEPGSNSLVNCYIMHLKRIIYFTSSFQLIFRLTCSSCPTPTGFCRQVSKLLFLYNLFRKIPLTKYVETLQEPALFNSQGSVVTPRGNGYLLYHRLNCLSSFFLKLFQTFFETAVSENPSQRQLIYINTLLLPCQLLF